MQTYWVVPKKSTTSEFASEHSSSESETEVTESCLNAHRLALEEEFGSSAMNHQALLSSKMDRLVDWSVGAFQDVLKRLVAYRTATGQPVTAEEPLEWPTPVAGETLRDEVVHSITLPSHRLKTGPLNHESIQLPEQVSEQLCSFLSVAAYSCQSHAYHNFERSCYVVMSVKKLLQQISSLSQNDIRARSLEHAVDPLGQIALIFAALVRNMDHRGVPNSVLVREGDPMAAHYKNKSIAEQTALDMALTLLAEPTYEALCSYLFPTQDDLSRFRKLVINATMATDIADEELNRMRDQRWNDTFSESSCSADRYSTSKKATIIFELIAQASDVCEAMQDWVIYEKWVRLLLEEGYVAYKDKRIEGNPLDAGYGEQLSFFDDHVVRLARKLKHCQVCGDASSSEEFLEHAMSNRTEWKNKGRAIIEEMKIAFRASAPLRFEL